VAGEHFTPNSMKIFLVSMKLPQRILQQAFFDTCQKSGIVIDQENQDLSDFLSPFSDSKETSTSASQVRSSIQRKKGQRPQYFIFIDSISEDFHAAVSRDLILSYCSY
jgi:hypothetical protein